MELKCKIHLEIKDEDVGGFIEWCNLHQIDLTTIISLLLETYVEENT